LERSLPYKFKVCFVRFVNLVDENSQGIHLGK